MAKYHSIKGRGLEKQSPVNCENVVWADFETFSSDFALTVSRKSQIKV